VLLTVKKSSCIRVGPKHEKTGSHLTWVDELLLGNLYCTRPCLQMFTGTR